MINKTAINESQSIESVMDVIYSFQYKYYCSLKESLNTNGFVSEIYTDKQSVMQILEYSIRFFAELFERWCIDNIHNSIDIGHIIFAYSSYENEKAKNSNNITLSELDIIALYTCRYILAIAPNLSLYTDANKCINENAIWFPELFALTNALTEMNQFRTIEGFNADNVCYIDLSHNFLAVEYCNTDLEYLLKKSKNVGERIMTPQLIDYSILLKFKDILIDAFGETADSLLSIFDDSYNNNEIASPKDFSPYINKYGNSLFVQELILDSKSVNFFNVISKPHINDHRTRYKPIIRLSDNGNIIYVSSKWLIFEAISELCMNRLPFNSLPKSWLNIDVIKKFADSISNDVGYKFEKFVLSKIYKKFPIKHDVKNIGNTSIVNFPVYEDGVKTKRTVGQIDFIILNVDKRIIYIADAKHLKSKYIVTSFYNDKSKFDIYYNKLKDKAKWAEDNKALISELFSIDVSSYDVQEFFITEAYIFYALFVNYPIIPVVDINKFLITNDRLCYLK